MTCKFDHKPCIRGACSEWDCACLNDPLECRYFDPTEVYEETMKQLEGIPFGSLNQPKG